MKFNQIFAVLGLIILIISCNFKEKDKHPKTPFFHEILNDENIFTSIYKTDEKPIFINDRMFMIVSTSEIYHTDSALKDLKNNVDSIAFNYELRDYANNIILNEKIIVDDYYSTPNVFIDSNSNLYINDKKYLAPTYTQKEKIELIIIQNELNNYCSTIKNPNNLSLDSIRKNQFLVLQKKYNFIAEENQKFVLQNDRLIMLTNELVNEFKHKIQHFDEFDTPSTVEYISHGRFDLTPYKYYYYKHKNIKFKYSQPVSGLYLPILFKSEEQIIMFHSKNGFYKVM